MIMTMTMMMMSSRTPFLPMFALPHADQEGRRRKNRKLKVKKQKTQPCTRLWKTVLAAGKKQHVRNPKTLSYQPTLKVCTP